MTQVTTGIRSILSAPVVYRTLQFVLGAPRGRRLLLADHLRPRAGDVVLDIGCGTGELFEHMPAGVDYRGFDLSPDYIREASRRPGGEGRFFCADVADLDPGALPPCDLVIAIGLLHHLDDGRAAALMATAHDRLRPGGRLVTLDCAFVDGQSPIARALIRADRGQDVRTPEGYAALARQRFDRVDVHVRNLLRVPYTHCILECTR